MKKWHFIISFPLFFGTAVAENSGMEVNRWQHAVDIRSKEGHLRRFANPGSGGNGGDSGLFGRDGTPGQSEWARW